MSQRDDHEARISRLEAEVERLGDLVRRDRQNLYDTQIAIVNGLKQATEWSWDHQE